MKCPNCGAGVSIRPNMRRFTCRKCGVQFPIASSDEPKAPEPAALAPEPPAPEPPQPATPTPEKKRVYEGF